MTSRHRMSWKEIQAFQNNQIEAVLNLTDRFGRVAELNMLGQHVTLLAEPDIIQQFLLKKSAQINRDPFTHRVFKRIVGNGVFIAEGKAWQRKRKLIAPIFHATHIQGFATTFVQQTEKMLSHWPSGKTIRFDQEMMGLTLRIICQTMFGSQIDRHVDRISDLMGIILKEAEKQLRPPIPDWVPTIGMLRQKRAVNEIRGLLLDIIRDRQQILAGQAAANIPAEHYDLLTMLITSRDENGAPLSDIEILEECLTIFIAGHETTAIAMTWTMAALLDHPEIFTRLKIEIEEELKGDPLTVEKIKSLPYLTQVIKESLRCYPPAHGFGRTPLEDFEIGEYHFQKGDIVLISSHALHHQADFYPNPERFDPERFASGKEPPHRYAYIPFGAGSRTCIGNAFAMLEMQMILTTLIQQVELQAIPSQKTIPGVMLTYRPINGLQVKAVPLHPSSL